ncbi:LytTR family two component transcriptional regulator [Mucilaginibacter gracilis]|uniref:LytTR family two component transcriptional regulator n=1 Tax=Mucilaginibacter gracilis TaxID=423350 RepID=A0A495J3F5_9SPHI|nr:response regulator [Mucilaginibacter gracilis]RKR82908.1 LytTR family two component transcriptional regulator [Mucilaginibacter gracilis]
MIRCMIVDDEPLALEILEHLINRFPALELIGKCSNAMAAFEMFHNQPVDLIFLDIKMPGISGLDFISSLKEPPSVVFTTAFAEYAVNGFELDAIDYLLKPITHERFEKCIQKILKIRPPKVEETKNYTYFKISGRLIKVPHTQLLYAQSVKDYILLCTKTGNYLTHMTMKYLEELLPANAFLRVHRSYLVNRELINLIDKSSLLIGEERIPVGENYRKTVEKIA